MLRVIVHPHALKHGLTEKDIRHAWKHFVRRRHRESPRNDQIVAIGHDGEGRAIQMLAVAKPFGVLLYHALTPPTNNVLAELGMSRRRK